MNILIFNWRDIKNPEAGGVEVHLHEIFKRIAKTSNVTLISSKFKNCQKSEVIDGIKILRIGNKFLFNYAVFWYYIKKGRMEEFDVVIDDISKVPIFSPLFIKKPIIALIHHFHGKTLFLELPLFIAFYVYLLEKLISIFYKKIPFITVSQSTKEELIKNGIPSSKITVIFNAFDNILLEPGEKSVEPEIVYLGRIKKYKRIDHLIIAFDSIRKKIKIVKLIILGDGSDCKRINCLIKKKRLEAFVQVVRKISNEEKKRMLQRAWVFTTASMKEGWGITVLEANACGTPAIAYNVPGLRDSIKHGYNGFLVENGYVTALAKKIEDVITNKELRQRLGENALVWSKQFSWDKSSVEFEGVLKKMSGKK